MSDITNLIIGATIPIVIMIINNVFDLIKRDNEHKFEKERSFDQRKLELINRRFQEIEECFEKYTNITRHYSNTLSDISDIFKETNETNLKVDLDRCSKMLASLNHELDDTVHDTNIPMKRGLLLAYGDDELVNLFENTRKNLNMFFNLHDRIHSLIRGESTVKDVQVLNQEIVDHLNSIEFPPEIVYGKAIKKIDDLHSKYFIAAE